MPTQSSLGLQTELDLGIDVGSVAEPAGDAAQQDGENPQPGTDALFFVPLNRKL